VGGPADDGHDEIDGVGEEIVGAVGHGRHAERDAEEDPVHEGAHDGHPEHDEEDEEHAPLLEPRRPDEERAEAPEGHEEDPDEGDASLGADSQVAAAPRADGEGGDVPRDVEDEPVPDVDRFREEGGELIQAEADNPDGAPYDEMVGGAERVHRLLHPRRVGLGVLEGGPCLLPVYLHVRSLNPVEGSVI